MTTREEFEAWWRDFTRPLIERLKVHSEDKRNTAFSRSSMREAIEHLSAAHADAARYRWMRTKSLNELNELGVEFYYAAAYPNDLDKAIDEAMGLCDTDDYEDVAFRDWQTSRAFILEEAAKECDEMQAMFERQSLMNEADAAEQCAMGIRALKD